jgi:hypothetical protein
MCLEVQGVDSFGASHEGEEAQCPKENGIGISRVAHIVLVL